MVGIYKITNIIDGKVYIGQSTDIERRWTEHRHHSENRHLRSAICKYGIESFIFEILECVDTELLCERERYWIAFYGSTNPDKGYNFTSGGEREPGWAHSEATKQRLSKLLKQKYAASDYVNPQAGTHLIHKGDITTRCKDSELADKLDDGWELGFSEKSKQQGIEHRKGELNGVYGKGYLFQGEKNHFYGKHHTAESIQKIKDHMPDTTYNWRGKHHTEEAKQKMRGPRPSVCGQNNPNYGKRGVNNAMFGRKCIHKGDIERRIPASELDTYLSDGWELGRAIIPYKPKK